MWGPNISHHSIYHCLLIVNFCIIFLMYRALRRKSKHLVKRLSHHWDKIYTEKFPLKEHGFWARLLKVILLRVTVIACLYLSCHQPLLILQIKVSVDLNWWTLNLPISAAAVQTEICVCEPTTSLVIQLHLSVSVDVWRVAPRSLPVWDLAMVLKLQRPKISQISVLNILSENASQNVLSFYFMHTE